MEGALRELNDLQTVYKKRLQIFRQENPGVYKTILWLRRNKDQFIQTIHEPMQLLINVKQSVFAKCFESLINYEDLIAFTCENKDDMSKFLKIVCGNPDLKIEVVLAPKTFDMSRPYSLEELKKYGFWAFMSDLCTAPQPIMNYLCRKYKLHKIPVGNRITEKMIDSIPHEISSFFTETFRVYIWIDRHSNEKCLRFLEHRQASSLNINVDNIHLRRPRISKVKKLSLTNSNQGSTQLHEECLNIQTVLDECKGEIALVRDKLSTLLVQQDYINQMKLKLKIKLSKLDQLEKRTLDIEFAKAACQENVEDENDERVPSFSMTQDTDSETTDSTYSSCSQSSFSSTESISYTTLHATSEVRKTVKRRIETENDPSEEIATKLRRVERDDRHDIFGKFVASKLRNVENNRLIFADKIISDVLFKAELNNLTQSGCEIP